MSEAERILATTAEQAIAGAGAGAGALITPARLAWFAPACNAAALAPALQAAADRFGIATPLRAAHWLGQIHVESLGLTRLVENLSYSAQRLCEVWPGRFPTLQAAQACAANPGALAEAVYTGRMGNTQPGDALRFIGRGLIQLTGRANYERFGAELGLDLVGDPALAAQPGPAAMIAGAFWAERGLNAAADREDLSSITRAINGGLTGLTDRAAQVARAKAILAA